MRKINRVDPQPATLKVLNQRTNSVIDSPEPKKRATQLWASFSGAAREDIRRTLRAMATGLERCMYCEDGHGTDIEHFYPKSVYPARAFDWSNYLLACSECNSNYKRNQFPLDDGGEPLLIDPTQTDPKDHLEFSTTTGEFSSNTPRGAASVEIFRLNRQICATGRRDSFLTLLALFTMYDKIVAAGSTARAEAILSALRNHPFQSVRSFVAQLPEERKKLELTADVIEILNRRPELLV